MGFKLQSLGLTIQMGAEMLALGIVRASEKMGGKYIAPGTHKGLERRLVDAILHDADAMVAAGSKEFVPAQVSLIERARAIAHELTGAETMTGGLLGMINLYTDVDTLVDGIILQSRSQIGDSIAARALAACTGAVIKHVLRFFSQFAAIQSLNMSPGAVHKMQARRAEVYDHFDHAVVEEFSKDTKATHGFHDAFKALTPDKQKIAKELLGRILVNRISEDIVALENLLANGQTLDTKAMNAIETFIKDRCAERDELEGTLSQSLLEAQLGTLKPEKIQKINDLLGTIFSEFSEQIFVKYSGRFLFKTPFNLIIQEVLREPLSTIFEQKPELKKEAEALVLDQQFDTKEEAVFYLLSQRDRATANELYMQIQGNIPNALQEGLPEKYRPFSSQFQIACTVYLNDLFEGTNEQNENGQRIFSASSLKNNALQITAATVTSESNKEELYAAFRAANPELIGLIDTLFNTGGTNSLGAIEVSAVAAIIQLVPNEGLGVVMGIVGGVIDDLIKKTPQIRPLRGFILGTVRSILQHVIAADPRYKFDITQREPEKIKLLSEQLEGFVDGFVKDLSADSATMKNYDKSLGLARAFFASPTLSGSIFRLVSSLYKQDPEGTPQIVDDLLTEAIYQRLPDSLSDYKPIMIGLGQNLFRGIFANNAVYDANSLLDPNVEVDQEQLQRIGQAMQEAVDQIKCNVLGDSYMNAIAGFLVNTLLGSSNVSEGALSALKAAKKEDVDASLKLILDGVFRNPDLAPIIALRPQIESLLNNLLDRLVFENDEVQPSQVVEVAIPAANWLQAAVSNITSTFRSKPAVTASDLKPLQSTAYRVRHTPLAEREIVREAAKPKPSQTLAEEVIAVIRAYEAALSVRKAEGQGSATMRTFEGIVTKLTQRNTPEAVQLANLIDPEKDISDAKQTLYFDVSKDGDGKLRKVDVMKHTDYSREIADADVLKKAKAKITAAVESNPVEYKSRLAYWTLGMCGGPTMILQAGFEDEHPLIGFNIPGSNPTTFNNLSALLQVCNYDYNLAYQVTRYLDTWLKGAAALLPESQKVSDGLVAFKHGNQLLYYDPNVDSVEKAVSLEPAPSGNLKVTIKYRQKLIGISSPDEPMRLLAGDVGGPQYIEVEYALLIKAREPQVGISCDETSLDNELNMQFVDNACKLSLHTAEGVSIYN